MAKNRDRIFNSDKTFNIIHPISQSTRDGVFRMSTTSIEKYKSNLYTLIFTGVGERPMEPNFGTILKYLLFDQLTNETYERIRDDILSKVSYWIPEITISEISFGNELDDRENNRISIKISFGLTIDPTIQEIIEIEMGV
jgi:phage baseplate assembly protein W